MIELAKTMRKDFPDIFKDSNKGNAGLGAIAPIGYDSYENMIISLCEMNNVSYAGNTDLNNDGTLSKDEAVLFNNTDFYNLLAKLKSYYDDGLITISSTLSFYDTESHYINEPFTDETSFMVINSTTGATWCASDEFISSVAPTPSTKDNENSKVISQGGSIVFFDKGDDENKAAFEFYKFMTNTQNAASFAAKYGSNPIRSSSFNETTITDITRKKDKSTVKTHNDSTEDETQYMTANIYELINDYSKNSQQFVMPVSNFSSKIRSTLGDLVTNVFKAKGTAQQIASYIMSETQKAYNNI